nr:UbiA family prenyltransferase [Pseudomonadota bacterium]
MTAARGHTDIRTGDWVDRILPPSFRPYARLARLDRPTGTWLLLFPCWWGVVLANQGHIHLLMLVLFGLAAVVMRGAGCTFNDIMDRDLDARVERTRHRPLPRGDVSVRQALLFLAVQLLLGFFFLMQFNRTTILLGAASLFLAGFYPLMKRLTWWPQLFLGFTFNWGALMGWAAVRG